MMVALQGWMTGTTRLVIGYGEVAAIGGAGEADVFDEDEVVESHRLALTGYVGIKIDSVHLLDSLFHESVFGVTEVVTAGSTFGKHELKAGDSFFNCVKKYPNLKPFSTADFVSTFGRSAVRENSASSNPCTSNSKAYNYAFPACKVVTDAKNKNSATAACSLVCSTDLLNVPDHATSGTLLDLTINLRCLFIYLGKLVFLCDAAGVVLNAETSILFDEVWKRCCQLQCLHRICFCGLALRL